MKYVLSYWLPKFLAWNAQSEKADELDKIEYNITPNQPMDGMKREFINPPVGNEYSQELQEDGEPNKEFSWGVHDRRDIEPLWFQISTATALVRLRGENAYMK